MPCETSDITQGSANTTGFTYSNSNWVLSAGLSGDNDNCLCTERVSMNTSAWRQLDSPLTLLFASLRSRYHNKVWHLGNFIFFKADNNTKLPTYQPSSVVIRSKRAPRKWKARTRRLVDCQVYSDCKIGCKHLGYRLQTSRLKGR